MVKRPVKKNPNELTQRVISSSLNKFKFNQSKKAVTLSSYFISSTVANLFKIYDDHLIYKSSTKFYAVFIMNMYVM